MTTNNCVHTKNCFYFQFWHTNQRNGNETLVQRSRPWRDTEVSNDKNPPKIKLKNSWNWLVIRMATTFWYILKIKYLQWPETEIKWICWNLIWKIREITVGNFFWRVLVIWNLCAVATVILPMSCTETFGQLLQLIGTIQGGG